MSNIQVYLDKARFWVQSHPWKAVSIVCGIIALWFVIHGVDLYGQTVPEQ